MEFKIGDRVRLEGLDWRFRLIELLADGERVVITRVGAGPESFNSSVIVSRDKLLPADADSPPASRC